MVAWPAEGSLHLERFAAPEAPARDVADEHAVEVVLAESGRTVMVGPETSILAGAAGRRRRRAATTAPRASAASCETKVIDGEVDHRDYVLTDREKAAGDCMMVCVSRACGKRLVLGL